MVPSYRPVILSIVESNCKFPFKMCVVFVEANTHQCPTQRSFVRVVRDLMMTDLMTGH